MSTEGRADSTLPKLADMAATSQSPTAPKPGTAAGVGLAVVPALGPPKETLESILLALDTER